MTADVGASTRELIGDLREAASEARAFDRAARRWAGLKPYRAIAETLMATPSSSGRAASGRRWMNSVEKFESS